MFILKEILKVVRLFSIRVKVILKEGVYNVIKRILIRKNGRVVFVEKGVIGKIINGVY